METLQVEAKLARLPFYYGWVNATLAALAMVGTLPGRTQGLGLITEPLIRDLKIDRVLYADINLWATLIGALFCIGIGRLIDRIGSRVALTGVALALGAVTLAMSGASGVIWLASLITLTRGFGQSALSVISLTIVGQWFARRLSRAMAAYSIIVSVGFMIAFTVVGPVVVSAGWRAAWAGVGAIILFGLAPAGWLFVRRSPEDCGLTLDGEKKLEEKPVEAVTGATLSEALATPAFWIFALGSSIYGLIASGIALFNESILVELGFDASTYHRSLAIAALTSLIGNFLAGWLATKWSLNRLMALAMSLLALSLLALPGLRTQAHVAAYATVMGIAGGFVIVLFFSFWSHAFGRAHLGKIQGVAQASTVIASAVGPLLLAECVTRTGSYAAIFYLLAAIVGALGAAALFTRIPSPNSCDI
ncbi:MAG TPA: MFS transporter [Blastocatellia bacterium]|nr:MFS transporter [Blastocatellia bacterium]